MTTQHYERRDDGFYVAWGADFFDEKPGSKKVEPDEAERLESLDPAKQGLYMDLRARSELNQVLADEMGRCRRCDEYVPAAVEDEELHVCSDLNVVFIDFPPEYTKVMDAMAEAEEQGITTGSTTEPGCPNCSGCVCDDKGGCD